IKGFSQVGFEAWAHGVLGRRCRRDMVQDGVRELTWDERGIVGLLAGKMVRSLLGSGDGFKPLNFESLSFEASLLDYLRKLLADPAFGVDFQSCVDIARSVKSNKKKAWKPTEEPLVCYGTTSEPNEPDIGSGSEAEVDPSRNEVCQSSRNGLGSENDSGGENGSGSVNGSGSDSGSNNEDNDYFVDAESLIDDVEVDMADFKSNTHADVEWVGCKETVIEERVFEVERPEVPDSQERRFKRIYVCLGPLKHRFRAGGRDFLGLDGCFLFGPYHGQILTTVVVDPNNVIYPLAYVAVESKNKDSWKWFLDCLGDDLELFKTLTSHLYLSGKRQLVDGRDKPIISYLKYIRGYLMKRIVNVQKVQDKCDGPLTPNAAKVFKLIKKATVKLKEIGVEWDTLHTCATWKEMYMFKINPVNGLQAWEKSDVLTTIIPSKPHPQIGKPPKKRKKRVAELEDEMINYKKLTRTGKTGGDSQGGGDAGSHHAGGGSQRGGDAGLHHAGVGSQGGGDAVHIMLDRVFWLSKDRVFWLG
nr:hypothetical protein [Tanacetum cinerariifolium]